MGLIHYIGKLFKARTHQNAKHTSILSLITLKISELHDTPKLISANALIGETANSIRDIIKINLNKTQNRGETIHTYMITITPD